MKILYVITHGNRGGAQANVLALAAAAKRGGHNVVVGAGEGGWLGDELRRRGIPVIRFSHLKRSWNPLRAALFVGELRGFLRRQPADIVHFHSSNALVGILAVRSLGAGWPAGHSLGGGRPAAVATIHGWSVLHPGWRESALGRAFYRAAVSFLLRRADKVIFVCRSDERLAAERGLVPPEKGLVVRNGIASSMLFGGRSRARQILIGSTDEPPKRFVVGTVARLDYPKNPDMLVSAAVRLRGKGYDFRILGNGPDKNRVERLIAAAGLGGSVRLMGGIAEPARLISGFDAFVLTSRYEGMPYALLEAALARLPIIATDVGGVSEVIEHGVTGRLVPSGDAAALAREIEEFARRPDEAGRLAAAAYDKVKTEFSEERMTEMTLGVYEELYAGKDS